MNTKEMLKYLIKQRKAQKLSAMSIYGSTTSMRRREKIKRIIDKLIQL